MAITKQTIVNEEDSLCSVELGETAPEGKGKAYIKSVKAYGMDTIEAGEEAYHELLRLRAMLDADGK